jgi:hypothetical protein
MKILYLCGPINGCSDAEAKDWRELAKKVWDGPTLDPMRRDYRGKEDQNVDEIVELDKVDIVNSSALLVNYDKPSVGTSMEMLYAFERGKIVVVVAKADTRISPWMHYHSHKITHSFAAAFAYLNEVMK